MGVARLALYARRWHESTMMRARVGADRMRCNRFGELRADRVAVKIPHLTSPKGRGTGGVAPLGLLRLGGDRFRRFTSAASSPAIKLTPILTSSAQDFAANYQEHSPRRVAPRARGSAWR